MPKWKKNAKTFTVAVRYNDKQGIQTQLPKPVAEFLGNPDEITFQMKGKKLLVEAANGQQEEATA